MEYNVSYSILKMAIFPFSYNIPQMVGNWRWLDTFWHLPHSLSCLPSSQLDGGVSLFFSVSLVSSLLFPSKIPIAKLKWQPFQTIIPTFASHLLKYCVIIYLKNRKRKSPSKDDWSEVLVGTHVLVHTVHILRVN